MSGGLNDIFSAFSSKKATYFYIKEGSMPKSVESFFDEASIDKLDEMTKSQLIAAFHGAIVKLIGRNVKIVEVEDAPSK